MSRIGQHHVEWALLGMIALVCGVLSFLQYRRTGELSRAEPALLRAGLNDQLRRLSQSFTADTRENCAALLPATGDIQDAGREEAQKKRYAQWAASHDRSFFSRIAVAAPDHARLSLYALDAAGQLNAVEWPANWGPLREGTTHARARRSRNGSGPQPGEEHS